MLDLPDLSTKMDKAEILTNLPVSSNSYWALLFATICILSIVSFSNPKRQTILQNVPVVGIDGVKSIRQARENFRHGSKNILLEGYRKVHLLEFILNPARLSQYKGSPFYVPTKMGERLMIPAKYVEELKNAPASQADFPATFIEVGLAFQEEPMWDHVYLICRCTKGKLLLSGPSKLSIHVLLESS